MNANFGGIIERFLVIRALETIDASCVAHRSFVNHKPFWRQQSSMWQFATEASLDMRAKASLGVD